MNTQDIREKLKNLETKLNKKPVSATRELTVVETQDLLALIDSQILQARLDERQSINFHRAYGKDYQETLELLEEQNERRIETLTKQQEGK